MDSNVMSILGTLMSEIAEVKAVVTGHGRTLNDLSYQVAQQNYKFEELKKQPCASHKSGSLDNNAEKKPSQFDKSRKIDPKHFYELTYLNDSERQKEKTICCARSMDGDMLECYAFMLIDKNGKCEMYVADADYPDGGCLPSTGFFNKLSGHVGVTLQNGYNLIPFVDGDVFEQFYHCMTKLGYDFTFNREVTPLGNESIDLDGDIKKRDKNK